MTGGGRNLDGHRNEANNDQRQQSSSPRLPRGRDEEESNTRTSPDRNRSYPSIFPRGNDANERLQQIRSQLSDYRAPMRKLPQGSSMSLMPGFPVTSRPTSVPRLNNMTTYEVLEMAKELTSGGL